MALTKKQIEQATKIVNAWFDKRNNFFGDPELQKYAGWLNQPNYYPEGHPNFVPDWNWGAGPAATFIFEGCPIEEWVHACSGEIQPELDKIGVFCEPYTSFALSIYDNR